MNPLNSSVPPIKRPSRSNSTSSSTTLRKTGSLSSRTRPRTSVLRGRSTSPDSISRVLHSLNGSRQDTQGRPESTERRKPNTNFNVNRWSHSTSSSISGLDSEFGRKRTSSSGAVRRSVAGFHAGMSGFIPQDTKTSQVSPRKNFMKRSSGGNTSHEGSSRLNFQDSSHLNVVRDLAQPTTNAGNTEFFNSTWEHRAGVNKFGQPVQGVSLQYTSDPASSNPDGAGQVDRNLSPTRLGHRDRASRRSKDYSKNSNISANSDQSRGKSHRSPKQKDMLSKALAMANNAVLLDNAQNIPGAIEAYNDACELLEQVMVRSSDMEDRRKLSAIRTTYSNRIAELHDLDDSFADLFDKALPDDPPSDEYDQPEDYYHDDSSFHARTSAEIVPTIELPLRQESLLPQIFGGDGYLQHRSLQDSHDSVIVNSQLNVPMDAQYMPSPLSPRHPPSVHALEENLTPTLLRGVGPSGEDEAGRGASTTSWLQNFDTPSSKSSSRLSSVDFGQGDGQLVSDIQAEFDAAMNAAVDSAYDDEMSQEPTPRNPVKSMNALQHEALATRDNASGTIDSSGEQLEHPSDVSPEDEAAEEERLLDEMTKEYGLEESSYDNQDRRTLPRESDSSGFSSRTWGSYVASIATTSGTALSTLAEAIEPIASAHQTFAKSTPHAAVTLSRRPSQTSVPSISEKHVPIRDRRMSAQSAKQLKIETFARHNSITRQLQPQSQPTPTIEILTEASPSEPANDFPSFTSTASGNQPLTPLTSIASGDSRHGDSPATPALTQGGSIDDNTNIPSSPSRVGRMMPPPPLTRKNVSTSSLKKGSLSINTATADLLDSPLTPNSIALSGDLRNQSSSSTPANPTPNGTVLTSGATGGMYLFDDQTGRLNSSHIEESRGEDVASLEPCPESFLLRPFWLMRSLCLALTQPEGGYVTQKLFLSRDIWRVRNVKFKALDEKISTCDLLTAALLKLAKVDTLDAAAVLDEVQSLEAVLEQVRSTLSKKLGSDVGLAGSTSVFKNSSTGDETNDVTGMKSVNTSSAAKSIASGWRKLRSKSSSANLTSGNIIRDVGSQTFTMSSLPMTTSASVATSRSYLSRNRDPPPTPSQLPNMPTQHAVYMSSLARLFSAAQVLDSIARQVEDPGLKYSSKIHVGLELSMRSAAEFFAFYIIRFVMSDLLMLVDKFLKRGTEWVLT